MNRIFKIVFNHVLGRHVVVSELARSCTKKSAKTAVAVALATLGIGAFTNAYAQQADVDPTHSSVVIGKDDNGKYYLYQNNQPNVRYYIAGASGGGVMTESYEGTQTVTTGGEGTGSTEFTIINVATGNENPIGTMEIKAGAGITIGMETVPDTTANGQPIERQIAVISAEAATYGLESAAGSGNAAVINLTTEGSTGPAGTVNVTGDDYITVTGSDSGIALTLNDDNLAKKEDLKSYKITDFTLENNTLSITQENNDGSPLTVENIATLNDIKTYTGGDNITINENGEISATNTYTTGGTFDSGSKKITFTRTDVPDGVSETYDVDLSGVALASDVKTYTGQQETSAGSDFGQGSSKFTIYEHSSSSEGQSGGTTGADSRAADAGTPVGEMNIAAGENVKIGTDAYGAAIISAKDTTYSYEVDNNPGEPGKVSKLTVTDDSTEETVAEFYDTDTRNTVVAGKNITVDEEENPDDGSITYTIHGKDTKVTSEDNSVTITENVDEEKGVTTYDLSVSAGSGASEFEGDDGVTVKPDAGKLTIKGGAASATSEDNIRVEADGENGLKVKLAKDIKGVDTIQVNKSVTVGDTTINKDGMTVKGGPTITKTNIDMGGQQIHNVGRGSADTDAANVAQIKEVEASFNGKLDHLRDRIGDVAEDANAGVAMALAAASLPQAYLPGKSMMSVAGGTYRGQQGYAIGFSTVTDNGKWVIKANATGNSQGHYGAAVGAGYMW